VTAAVGEAVGVAVGVAVGGGGGAIRLNTLVRSFWASLSGNFFSSISLAPIEIGFDKMSESRSQVPWQ